MSDIKDYPKSMVERQFTKLQKHLLTDYKEEDDEAFSGTIRTEVMEIVQKNTPIGKILDEEGFALIVVKIIEDLHDWVMETLDGIDSDLLKLFLVDFVQQVIHNTFTVSPSDPPFDPMYG
jgi:hypothetical protein|tara:strand:+ start:1311 stop:1670 length:360 start_codon:yes stop_codon:yes gene_type:complete